MHISWFTQSQPMIQHSLIAMEPSVRIRSNVKYILALIRPVSDVPFVTKALHKPLHISVSYRFSSMSFE